MERVGFEPHISLAYAACVLPVKLPLQNCGLLTRVIPSLSEINIVTNHLTRMVRGAGNTLPVSINGMDNATILPISGPAPRPI